MKANFHTHSAASWDADWRPHIAGSQRSPRAPPRRRLSPLMSTVNVCQATRSVRTNEYRTPSSRSKISAGLAPSECGSLPIDKACSGFYFDYLCAEFTRSCRTPVFMYSINAGGLVLMPTHSHQDLPACASLLRSSGAISFFVSIRNPNSRAFSSGVFPCLLVLLRLNHRGSVSFLALS